MQPDALGTESREELLRVAELRVAVVTAEPLQHLQGGAAKVRQQGGVRWAPFRCGTHGEPPVFNRALSRDSLSPCS